MDATTSPSNNEVLDFVTSKEKLKDAEGNMVLAYYDYQDNSGSEDRDHFWRDFEEKRNIYRRLKAIVLGEEDDRNT